MKGCAKAAMNEAQALRHFLKNDRTIQAATSEAKARLLAHAEVIDVGADEIIFSPTDRATHTYFVAEGAVYLFPEGDAAPALVEAGQYIGQEAGIHAQNYATRALSKQPSVLIKIPHYALEQVFFENPTSEDLFITSIFQTILGKFLPVRPPEESQEKKALLWVLTSDFVGWLYAIIIPFLIYLALQDVLPDKSSRLFLGLLSIALCMWVFDIVQAYIPSIFLVVAVMAAGIAPPKVILGGFASEVFIAALCIYAIGSVILNSGIVYRLLLSILKYIPENHFWFNATTFFLGLCLTPSIPTAAHRGALMAGVVSDLTFYANLKPGSVGVTRLAISAYSGTMLFSAIFLSSSLHNFIILGLLWAQDQERFQWLGWLQAAAMPGLIMMIAYAVVIPLMGQTSEVIKINRERILEQASLLGKRTADEQLAISCFLVFVVGVLTTSFHRLTPASVGLIVLFVLLTFNVLKRDNFQRDIEWPALITLGGLIGIMGVVDYLSLQTFFLTHIEWAGVYIKKDFRIFISVLFVIVFIVRLIVPYGPAIIILATLFMPIAQQYEISPWLVSFIILFWGKMWIFPRQYPPYGAFLDHCIQKDLFDKKTFFRFNMLMNLARIAAIYLSIPYWKSMGLV